MSGTWKRTLPAGLLALFLGGSASAQVVVTMMPVAGVAADGQPRGLNLVVALASGQLATDATVTFAYVDKGTLGECSSFSPGMLTCTYTPPNGGPEGTSMLIVDIAAGGQSVTKRFSIPFAAGAGAAAAPAVAPVVAPAVAPVVAPVATAPVATAPVATAPVATAPVTQPAAPVYTPPATTPAPVYTPPAATTPPPATTAPPPATQPAPWQPAAPPATTTTAPAATTTQPLTTPTYTAPAATATAPAGAAKFPFTEQDYRIARIYVRYPMVGYRYNQEAIGCERESCTFPNLEVAGPGGSGPVFAPASIAIGGEVYPIEFVGVAASFERVGYSTDQTVVKESGDEAAFGDGVHRIAAGARFRLPLLNNRANGPLDILVDLGYQGQDFLYFQTVPESSQWTFYNTWVHGFRFGFGLAFQAVPAVTPHGDVHFTAYGGGLVSYEAEVGVKIRLYKNLIADVGMIMAKRQIQTKTAEPVFTDMEGQGVYDEAKISDLSLGAGLTVGVEF